jgi:hypothetical protein
MYYGRYDLIVDRINYRIPWRVKNKGDVMKKIVIAICLICLITSTTMFAGCSYFNKNSLDYATNAVTLKSDTDLIKSQYKMIESLVDLNKAKFTVDEVTQLTSVNSTFTDLSNKIDAILANPKTVVTPAELKIMYNTAYNGYIVAKNIVSTHKADFTSLQWSQILDFDKQAIDYDKQVRLVLDNPSTADINMTIGLIITLGGVAVKYLLPVVISMI